MTSDALTDDEIRLIALSVASDAIDQEAEWQMKLHYDLDQQNQRRVMHEVSCISQELWDRAHAPVPATSEQKKKRQSRCRSH